MKTTKYKSTYEHCNAPKARKNCSSDPFMCLSGKTLLGATRICLMGNQIPKKWGSVFSRCEEASFWRTLLITKYVSW
jgi:hypothetical protein